MIVLGIDPSLRMTGLVLAEATENGITVINVATSETRPHDKGLKGREYERDVMVRAAYLFQSIRNFVFPLNLNAIICESVPFARGWKSGVASNALKGMVGAVASELCYDFESIHLVDPKQVKLDTDSGKAFINKYREIINGAEHKSKDHVLAFFLENAKSKTGSFELDYNRAQYEAVADAYGVIHSWWINR